MRRTTLCKINATHRRALASQRGSILPYLSVAVGIVALIALTLMTGLGDVIVHRRDASNAADAAALAAAEAWGHSIESSYGNATKSHNGHEFWGSVGKGVGSFAGSATKRTAEHYAKLNGATATSYSVDEAHGTATVSVRTDSTIAHTDKRMTATSTAKVVFESGACLEGGKLGYQNNGKCLTKQAERPPATPHSQGPSASPSPPQPPPPDLKLDNRQKVKVRTQLVS
ncbi:pilus assembly protein TadG-related protein [Actinomyces oris]|mgnify:FL=1|uniref:Putative Flp pilus-assembly TadG-like N-terminal domain-containing protein n=1 Tax=Actinomyces oris TaxID=544580 RepID=A0A1Q8X8Z0_9ACTO|nr:hypothetical protein BKH15_07860 [Actinomyces oris]